MKCKSFTILELLIALSLFSMLTYSGYWLIEIGTRYNKTLINASNSQIELIQNYGLLKRRIFENKLEIEKSTSQLQFTDIVPFRLEKSKEGKLLFFERKQDISDHINYEIQTNWRLKRY